ncbi:preprotein translocase subunit SecG [Kamptonema cortianum]|nr:preprotein translocase subunit SecG [Kamptonema cortianum]
MNLAITGFLSNYANVFIGILLVLNFFVCLLLIVAVLMQRSKNEGLGATFGGGTMDTAFGADTTNVLKKFTYYLTIAFFLLTVAMGWFFAHRPSAGVSAGTLQKVAAEVEAKESAPAAETEATAPAAGETDEAPATTTPNP